MKKRNFRSIISMLFITILSLAVIVVCVFFSAYGLSVRLQDEPFQVSGMSVYPNLDENGSPLSYSAVVYDARHKISQGNPVTYLEPQSDASCKLTTAYFYGIDDSECVLYNSDTCEFFNISREHLRGKALCYIPYLGAVLSLSSSVAGIAVFAVLGAAVLLLLLIYLITFFKNGKESEASQQPDAQPAEEYSEPDEQPVNEVGEQPDISSDEQPAEEEGEQTDELKPDEPAAAEEDTQGDALVLKVKSRGEKYYASVVGPIDKVTRLERAVNNLLEKKNIEMSVEPIEGEPAGTGIECDKDGLAIVIALVQKLNE